MYFWRLVGVSAAPLEWFRGGGARRRTIVGRGVRAAAPTDVSMSG